jgi:hypothetical protein
MIFAFMGSYSVRRNAASTDGTKCVSVSEIDDAGAAAFCDTGRPSCSYLVPFSVAVDRPSANANVLQGFRY